MKIGLTQRVLFHKQRAHDSIEHGWYSYLKGHALFPIANRVDQDFNQLADMLDCLIITGGDDSPIRRLTELKLTTAMMVRGKPVLGVCHGCFLLANLIGSTISEIPGHMDTDHTVMYRERAVTVNSFHNLSITVPHYTATVLATDLDGQCEAWIDTKCNIAGVVWHPERMINPWLPEEINNMFCHPLNISNSIESV